MPTSLASSFTITVSAGDYNGVVDGLGSLVKSHWIAPTSGVTTVTDRKGLQAGTLSGMVQYLSVPIAQGDATGLSIGVSDGARMNVPANAAYNATAGGVGGLFQFDQIGTAIQVLFSRSNDLPGGMSLEIANGQLSALRFDGTGVQRTVTATTLPSVGDAHAIFLTWGTIGLELWVDGVLQGSTGITNWAVNGTVAATPLSWLAWDDDTIGFDGCAGHFIFLGGAQPTPAQIAALSQPKSIAWAVPIDAGSVEASQFFDIDLRRSTAHYKSPIVPALIGGQPALGTVSVVGEMLRYTAGATLGNNDTFQARFTSAASGAAVSNTVTATIDVAAQSVSDIELTPIHMWRNPSNSELHARFQMLGPTDIGEQKITDTAITGATIQSPGPFNGQQLGAFPIEVDPTPYVSGAIGSKTTWSAQFRLATGTAKGAWSQLPNGNFQFTPNTTPGLDESEYQVRDTSSAAWSPWTRITARVLDRSLTPGPYFLIEDYSGGGSSYNGIDTPRFNAARSAAAAAGGGTVTTKLRDTVRMVTNHNIVPEVHYLFPNCLRPPMIHIPTGNTCHAYPTGNTTIGDDSDWQPHWNEPIFNGASGQPLSGEGRVNIMGGILDGNSFEMAITDGYTSNPVDSAHYGKCWPGGGTNRECFSLQAQALIDLQGSTNLSVSKAPLGVHGVILRRCPADIVHVRGSGDLILEDCISHGVYRGLVVDFGNSKIRAKRNFYGESLGALNENWNIGSGIDHEMLGYGSPTTWNLDAEHEDEYISEDFDVVIRGGIGLKIRGCVTGPGFDITSQKVTSHQTVTFEGSTANPRNKIRYHRRGPISGSDYPRTSIHGWVIQPPHDLTTRFLNCDFITWGAMYIIHEKRIFPTNNRTWEFDIGSGWEVTDPLLIELVNCTATVGPNMPSSGNTIRLFRTAKTLTTTQVLRLNGLTIGTGFNQAAIVATGMRVEYNTVVHQGFPGASISQIVTGAGQYVAI